MNFKITENETPPKYTAIVDKPTNPGAQAIFCGTGETLKEAIGACLIANREVLGFIFSIQPLNGPTQYSTEYGQPRNAT